MTPTPMPNSERTKPFKSVSTSRRGIAMIGPQAASAARLGDDYLMALLDQQHARPTLRANPRQRDALVKRGIEPPPAPAPEPPPAPRPSKQRHDAAWQAVLDERTAERRAQIMQRRQIMNRALKMRAKLTKRFPNCFADFCKPKRPLKVGITADVIAAAPDLDCNEVSNAITDYCSGKSYRAAMIEGVARIDLDGNAAGVVTKREAGHAVRKLKKIEEAAAAKLKKIEEAAEAKARWAAMHPP